MALFILGQRQLLQKNDLIKKYIYNFKFLESMYNKNVK